MYAEAPAAEEDICAVGLAASFRAMSEFSATVESRASVNTHSALFCMRRLRPLGWEVIRSPGLRFRVHQSFVGHLRQRPLPAFH